MMETVKGQESSNVSTKRPYISVIITAYNRKQYILQAINSALNQTLDRSLYEIIVVKNFSDDKIDSFIQDNNIMNILTDVKPLGAKIALGVENARGEVVSFLEDDDLFYADKLRTVYELFKKDGNLGYYHNSIIEIDENSKEIGRNRNNPKESIYMRDRESKNKLATSIFLSWGFNTSSISMRKIVFRERVDIISKYTWGVDNLLAIVAFFSDFGMLIDKNILTLYRVHQSLSQIGIEQSEDYETFSLKVRRNKERLRNEEIVELKKDFKEEMQMYPFLDLYSTYLHARNVLDQKLLGNDEMVEVREIAKCIYYHIRVLPLHVKSHNSSTVKSYVLYLLFISSSFLLNLVSTNFLRGILLKSMYSFAPKI